MKFVIPGLLFSLLAWSLWRESPDRAASSGNLPELEVTRGWASENSCQECHTQSQSFAETGHALTLRPASDPVLRQLIQSLNATPAAQRESMQVTTEGRFPRVQHREGQHTNDAELDWCFGSGHHARTWVGTLPDSDGATNLLEFRWTWYHDVDGFQVTPGQPTELDSGYYSHLGVLFDQPKARRCFGCHATHLPVDAGQIQVAKIQAGVTCQRCHGPREAHVQTGGAIQDHSWSGLSRDEQVARCAECHRHPEEQTPASIHTGNPDIVRFQPVGLMQSECFQKSKMTCTSCHDPHQTMESQDSGGIWQCIQCHDGKQNDRPGCRAGKLDNCLSCHMPKVSMDRPVRFTDHWIRIPSEKPLP